MKRLFAAIKVYPDHTFNDVFNRMKLKFRYDNFRWVNEKNIHITLKFFGETPEQDIPDIINALENAAAKSSDFEIKLNEIGMFGSAYNPKVLWIGIQGGEGINNLFRNIQNELKVIGIHPDRQNFVPHLTVGRVKQVQNKKRFQESLVEFSEVDIMKLEATRFHLFESILKPDGAVYNIIETFNLNLHQNK